MQTNSTEYRRLHAWLRKSHPKTGVCADCQRAGYTVWANIDNHNHAYDITKYRELCSRCHRKLDRHQESAGQAPIKPVRKSRETRRLERLLIRDYMSSGTLNLVGSVVK